MITLQKLTQKLCHKDKDMIIRKISNSGHKKACETARNVCDFARCAHPQDDRHPSLSDRKHHAKGGFIAWLRRGGDGSTMQGYYLLADTQPDARTVRLGSKERHKMRSITSGRIPLPLSVMEMMKLRLLLER